MGASFFSLFFTIFCCVFIVRGSIKSSDARNYLGTRTPYRFRSNKDDSKVKFPDCKETKIWMVIRHGTRLPKAKDIVGMNTTLNKLKYQILLAHKQGRGSLNAEELKSLEEWSTTLNVDQQKFLTREGREEMVLLAERMKKRFPNAVSHRYNNESYLFRYTATERAQQSAQSFTIGLFDKKDAQNVLYHPANRVDPVLRFYKHCDRWQKQVKKNPNMHEEQIAFGNSIGMNNSLASVSKRLGLDHVLSLDEVRLMYKICGFETAWSKHRASPWCAPFDKDSAQMQEYYFDLKHYWIDGYGHDLTYRQACIAIKHMFENFSNNTAPNATFLFAHSGTLLKVLAHLHLYKPQRPLRGDAIQRDREWNTSFIDCFAANLAFVLFKCKSGDYVLALHQEKIIKLPMCDHELCPLKRLLEYFHESIFNCDYSDMCSLSNEIGDKK